MLLNTFSALYIMMCLIS
uniref:Uncharacterized protein n=1 Tax=Anguilla anguilla TaxID=7936 RepID=A0A0E9UIC8_ANGAN